MVDVAHVTELSEKTDDISLELLREDQSPQGEATLEERCKENELKIKILENFVNSLMKKEPPPDHWICNENNQKNFLEFEALNRRLSTIEERLDEAQSIGKEVISTITNQKMSSWLDKTIHSGIENSADQIVNIQNIDKKIDDLNLDFIMKTTSLESKLEDLTNSISTTSTETKSNSLDNLEKRLSSIEEHMQKVSYKSGSSADKKFRDMALERLTTVESKIHNLSSTLNMRASSTMPREATSSVDQAEDPIPYCRYPDITGGITVMRDDYMCLDSQQFLNDVIIDFFLKFLQYSSTIKSISNGKIEKTYIFTTFFFSKLVNKLNVKTEYGEKIDVETGVQEMYDRVRKWTKKVDLLEKDFIVVPVNENVHWFVCIICYPFDVGSLSSLEDNPPDEVCKERKPCILVFDSLPDGPKTGICHALRSYLTLELKTRKPDSTVVFTEENLPQYNPKVRGQKNSKDCGIFLLQYVESFFRQPLRDWDNNEIDHRDWFPKEEVLNKRFKIAKLIRDLTTRQNYEKKVYRKPDFPTLELQVVASPSKKKAMAEKIKVSDSHERVQTDTASAKGKAVVFQKRGKQISVSEHENTDETEEVSEFNSSCKKQKLG